VADSPGIGACHLACWRETYAPLLSPGFFGGRSAPDWSRVLADPVPGQDVVIAEVDGEVVGLAHAVPSRDDPPVRPIELTTLYLRAARHGSGLGQALLDAVLGDRPASLWVAELNPRARRFYARNGFAPDGARKTLAPWEGLVEVRLVR